MVTKAIEEEFINNVQNSARYFYGAGSSKPEATQILIRAPHYAEPPLEKISMDQRHAALGKVFELANAACDLDKLAPQISEPHALVTAIFTDLACQDVEHVIKTLIRRSAKINAVTG